MFDKKEGVSLGLVGWLVIVAFGLLVVIVFNLLS